MVISNHRPPCLNQNLHKNKLRSNKSIKIREFSIAFIRRLFLVSDILGSKNLHSKNPKDIVANHIEREEFHDNGNNDGHLTDQPSCLYVDVTP